MADGSGLASKFTHKSSKDTAAEAFLQIPANRLNVLYVTRTGEGKLVIVSRDNGSETRRDILSGTVDGILSAFVGSFTRGYNEDKSVIAVHAANVDRKRSVTDRVGSSFLSFKDAPNEILPLGCCISLPIGDPLPDAETIEFKDELGRRWAWSTRTLG